jgi:hypothetical protein
LLGQPGGEAVWMRHRRGEKPEHNPDQKFFRGNTNVGGY